MIVGIIVSIAGLGVACMGMKCTTCGGSDRLRKSRIAMTGGIILLVGGEDANAPLEISPVFYKDQALDQTHCDGSHNMTAVLITASLIFLMHVNWNWN